MTSLGTLDLNFLTLRRLFPYRNGTTDISANTILLQNPQGEVVWINPADVFGDVSGTLVEKGTCDSDYLYWDQTSKLWLAGGSRVHIGCGAGVVQHDASAVSVAIGYNAGYSTQGLNAIAVGQYAGYSTQGLGAVAMGSYAGYVNQRADGVAIGTNAGVSTQGAGSIAIGASAGAVTQDASAVAIGFNAGLNIQGRGAVALGSYAGFMDQSGSAVAVGLVAGNAEQGFGAVAVGAGAGNVCQTTKAVAVGYYAGSGNQGTNAVAVGESAGASQQGIGSIAIGSLAGYSTQRDKAIAIGSNAGAITQGEGAVAVGYLAGSNVQRDGAVAIGLNAGFNMQDLNAVAMGFGAGYSSQGAGSVAIGSNAGYSTQNAGAVAIGMAAGFSIQGAKAIAIGSNAGFGAQRAGAVAMGAGAGYSSQGAGAVAIGSNAGYSTQGAGAVALGLSAGWSSQGAGAVAVGLNAGLSTQGVGAVAIGSNAGAVDQSANAVAIGLLAGFSSQGASAVAIGWMAGSNVQSDGAVAVGERAGLIRQGTNAVALGLGAGLSTQNANAIAIGSNAGYFTQGLNAIAFGQAAGISSQSANAIAIGSNAGGILQKVGAIAIGERAGLRNQDAGAVAIGSNAGVFDQSGGAIALGFGAGWSTQGIKSVAIGSNAGYTSQGTHAVAIGTGAGITSQSDDAIAIGSNAGATNQGIGAIAIGAIPASHIQDGGAIAIGYNAIKVNQGANAIAIGNNVCGTNPQDASAIAIGNNALASLQTGGSIVLNATGIGLSATQRSLYVDPVRNNSGDNDTTYLLQYEAGDKEVVYNNSITTNSGTGIINVSGDILPTSDILYSLGSSARAFKHLYVSSIVSDTSNVAVSGDIIPYADNLYSVGLSTQRWKDVFVGPGSVYIGGSTSAQRAELSANTRNLIVNATNGGGVGIGISTTTARLHVEGTSFLNSTITSGGNVLPSTTGSYDMGTASARWRTLYTSTIDSGTIVPTTDNTATLGLSTQRWKDVFVGPGSVYIGGSTSAQRAELSATTNNLIVNATNGGGLGIGISTTTARLHVEGTTFLNSTITSGGNVLPNISSAFDLGSPSMPWRNIYADNAYVTGGISLDGDIVPSTDNTFKIGTSTMRWEDVFVGSGGVYIGGSTSATRAELSATTNNLIVNATNGGGVGIGISTTTARLHVEGTTFLNSTITSGGNVLPSTTGSYDLGTSTMRWRSIYADNAYVTGGINLSGDIIPTADNTFKIGTSTMRWKDVFVGSGGVYIGGSTSATRAELSANTSNLIVNATNGGGVGIGTANPGATLDVSGNMQIASSGPVISCTTNNPGDMLVKSYGALDRYGIGQYVNGNMRVFGAGIGNSKVHLSKPNSSIQDGNASFTDVLTADLQNSRVGIGITTPLTKAHIYNLSPYTSCATNPLISGSGAPQLTLGADVARLYMGIYNTGGYGGSTIATIQSSVYTSFGGSDAGKDLLLNPIGGNVGIGTATPSASNKLHVEGASLLNGVVTSGGNVLPSTTGLYDLGSSLARWRTLYTSTIDSGTIVPTTDNTASLGLSTQRWKDVFVGPGSVYIGGTTNASRAVLEANSNSLIINATNGGNVGIGTGVPLTKTHIYNLAPYTSCATNPLISGSGGPQLTLEAGSARLYFGIYTTTTIFGTSTAATIQSSYVSGGDNGRDLLLNPLGGFVGIGTSNPYTTLDISGETRARTMNINSDTLGTPTGLYFNVANNAQFVIQRPADASDLRFVNNTAGSAFDQMTLKSNGNVGIGTNNPAYTLDVRGNAQFISSSSQQVRVTSTSSNTSDTAEIAFDRTNIGGGQFGLVGVDGTSSRGFFIYYNGADRLNIETASGAVRTRNNLAVGYTSSLTPADTLSVNGTGYFTGNVGIGTTSSATYALDVIGPIRGSAFITNKYITPAVNPGSGGTITVTANNLGIASYTNSVWLISIISNNNIIISFSSGILTVVYGYIYSFQEIAPYQCYVTDSAGNLRLQNNTGSTVSYSIAVSRISY